MRVRARGGDRGRDRGRDRVRVRVRARVRETSVRVTRVRVRRRAPRPAHQAYQRGLRSRPANANAVNEVVGKQSDGSTSTGSVRQSNGSTVSTRAVEGQ